MKRVVKSFVVFLFCVVIALAMTFPVLNKVQIKADDLISDEVIVQTDLQDNVKRVRKKARNVAIKLSQNKDLIIRAGEYIGIDNFNNGVFY